MGCCEKEDTVTYKFGLIARADQRGLAYQSYEMFKAMRPAKTLVITDVNRQFKDNVGMYKGAGVSTIPYSKGSLDEKKVRDFLEGLDLVWAHETLYDWRIADWARDMGVKTVVQANPELFTHHIDDLPAPDRWCFPTDWMFGRPGIPDGPVIPNPVPTAPVRAGDPEHDVLNVLHVAGHAAVGDRNGTLLFFEALASLRRRINVTVVGQDGHLPKLGRLHQNVTVNMNNHGVPDRWSMYEGQHVVVLPRRYGGGSIPAIEAIAAGCVLMMPDCSPNEMWPGPRLRARKGRLQRVKYGTIETSMVHPMEIAHRLNTLADNREALAAEMATTAAYRYFNRWDSLEAYYYRPFMEAVIAGEEWV